MATIGGLSSASSANGASSIRGYGGLASGLDRDSLIESMTYATTSKIQKQQQAKQKVAWRQEAMRGITDKLYGFSQSFISYTSSKSLLSTKLYRTNTITSLGENSKYITATGNSTAADSMSVLGVKQLATNAKLSFKSEASDQKLESAGIGQDLTVEKDFSTVAGTSFTVKYGSKYYSVSLPEKGEGYDYSTVDGVAASLNKALKEVAIGDGKTLADAISVSVSGDASTPEADKKLIFSDTDAAGNDITLAGESYGVLSNLGFDLGEKGLELTEGGVMGGAVKLTEKKSLADQLGGKQIAFSYNGKTEWITLADADSLKSDPAAGLSALASDMQTKLDKAFGKNRIEVGCENGKLVFNAIKKNPDYPDGGNNPPEFINDSSSVLSIGGAERGVLGINGALSGINAGDSNRLNLNSGFLESGLKGISSDTSYNSDSGKWTVNGRELGDDEVPLEINGVKIDIKQDSTLNEIINAINNSDAGVKVSYLAEADKFSVVSTADGASGEINIEGALGEVIFGQKDAVGGYSVLEGQDAVISVKYAGSDDIVEVSRGSNTFTLNGLTITAKGAFGYDKATGALDPAAEEVTFDVSMDTQPAVDAIKEMVEAYNEIIELVNEEVSTKPNRSYDPLTSEQEDGMTESQVKAWNEKAKAGLLFNDSDIRGLAEGLRSMISSDSATLKKLGITVSTSYSDNGKMVFDEETFKAALASDPESVVDALTRQAEKKADGTTDDAGGLMVRMQTLMNKYASTTGSVKGILIERAGSKYAPTSILTNSMQKQMDEIDDEIDRLIDKLETEQDRYISQFTRLETLISQMNSQSSWLQSSVG